MHPILVVLDPNNQTQTAVRKGFELALLLNADIELVAFCHAELPRGLKKQAGVNTSEIKTRVEAWRAAQAELTTNTLLRECPQYQGIRVSTQVVWERNIHQWIVKHAREGKYSYVVKTGHRSETAFYTPSDWHLIRKLSVPFYLVNEHLWKPKQRILVCLDVTSENAEKQQLNLHLLEHSHQLARAINAELHCCFVVQIPRALQELDIIDVSSYERMARENYLPAVITLVRPFGIDESQIHRAAGDPVERILKIARKSKSGCVVIGSIGRKGLAGKLIGNTAEQLLKELKTDMLVVNAH